MKSEIKRQLLHILFGIAIISFILIVSRKTALLGLLVLLLLSFALSFIATKKKIFFINWLLNQMGRKTEKAFPGKGFVFFIAGCLLVFKIFSQDIALTSITVLTFGDSISTLVGKNNNKKYDKKPFSKRKTVYGTLTGMIVSFFIALVFIAPIYAAVASAAGMLAEALSIKLGEREANDNLIIPLVAGTACYLLRNVIS